MLLYSEQKSYIFITLFCCWLYPKQWIVWTRSSHNVHTVDWFKDQSSYETLARVIQILKSDVRPTVAKVHQEHWCVQTWIEDSETLKHPSSVAGSGWRASLALYYRPNNAALVVPDIKGKNGYCGFCFFLPGLEPKINSTEKSNSV